jgi:hypothetical protein
MSSGWQLMLIVMSANILTKSLADELVGGILAAVLEAVKEALPGPQIARWRAVSGNGRTGY